MLFNINTLIVSVSVLGKERFPYLEGTFNILWEAFGYLGNSVHLKISLVLLLPCSD